MEITQTFDYGALDAETRIVVQQRETEIQTLVMRTAQDAIDVGKKLIEIKGKLAYGQFEKWYRAAFGFSRESANTFMRIAIKFEGHLSSDLTTATSVLALLSKPSTPEAAFDEGVKIIESGKTLEPKQAKAIVQKHKPEMPRSRPPGTEPITRVNVDDDYRDEVPSVEVEPPVQSPPSQLLRGNGYSAERRIQTAEPAKADPLANKDTQVQTGETAITSSDLLKRLEAQAHTIKAVMDENANLKKQIEALKAQPSLVDYGKQVGWNADQCADFILDVNPDAKEDPIYSKRAKLLVQFVGTFDLTPAKRLQVATGIILQMHTPSDAKPEVKKVVTKGKAKPASNIPVTDPKLIVELMAAYQHYSGLVDDSFYAKNPIRQKFEQLVRRGIKPEHVQSYIQGLLREPFWQKNGVSVDKMMGNIVVWLDHNCPGWKTPPPPMKSDGPEIEYIAVSLDELGVLSGV